MESYCLRTNSFVEGRKWEVKVIDGMLACPMCGSCGAALHQNTVAIGLRDEDKRGHPILVSGMHVTPFDATIPGRRDVIDIEFYCETCGNYDDPEDNFDGLLVLRIMQHKGATLMHWIVYDPKETK